MTFRSLLLFCLLVSPGAALALPRATLTDQVRGDRSPGDWSPEIHLMVNCPPDWVRDPGVRDVDLTGVNLGPVHRPAQA